MKKKILLSFVLSAGIILFLTTKSFTNAGGAPDQETGAPSEGTCFDCHSDKTKNDANGSLDVTLWSGSNQVNAYSPGVKYTVKVDVSRTGSSMWGFQTSVKKGTTSTDIGTISVTGSDLQKTGSGYASHTSSGNTQKSWSFSWTAPAKGTGGVKIYTAANAANGNGGSDGDYIYTNALAISENTAVSENINPGITELNVYPNPAVNTLKTNFSVTKPGVVEVNLMNIQGQLVRKLFYGYKTTGVQELVLPISEISAGLYMLQVTADGNSAFQKVQIQ